MPKRRDEWGLSAFVEDLHTLAGAHDGVHDVALSECSALLEHTAVQDRYDDSGKALDSARRAVMTTLNAVAGLEHVDAGDVVAVLVLLNAVDGVEDHALLQVLHDVASPAELPVRDLEPRGRAELARKIVAPHDSEKTFRQERRRKDGTTQKSEMTLLFERLETAFGRLEAPSATSGLSSTPLLVLPSDPETVKGLLGTWKGELQSDYEETPGKRLPEQDSYMAFVLSYQGRLIARHFVEQGSSSTVSQELLPNFDGTSRLIGVYEAESSLPRKWVDPPHRGAHILDLRGNPASRLEGRYWTDRKTTGTLVYDKWCVQEATSFAEAQAFEYVSPDAVRR